MPPVTTIDPEGQPLHRLALPIRWGDMDALGHVNNIMYFRYFEQTRLSWWETLDVGQIHDAGVADSMVIVDNHAEYLRPLVYPADIVVRMGGHSPGRSSFVTTYTLAVGDTLFTRGSSTIVWLDGTTGRPKSLPDGVRAMVSEGTVDV